MTTIKVELDMTKDELLKVIERFKVSLANYTMYMEESLVNRLKGRKAVVVQKREVVSGTVYVHFTHDTQWEKEDFLSWVSSFFDMINMERSDFHACDMDVVN